MCADAFVVPYGLWREYAPASTYSVTLRATIVPSAITPSLM